MRCFIGIDLSSANKLAIAQWIAAQWPELSNSKPVVTPNYHLTLLFLGQINVAQQQHLIGCLDQLDKPSFNLNLNQTGYWSIPPIAFLTDSHPAPALLQLQTSIEATIKEHVLSDLRTHPKFRPHVTLARKYRHDSPMPEDSFSFTQAVDQMHLFESVSGKQGVSYPIRHSWSLS